MLFKDFAQLITKYVKDNVPILVNDAVIKSELSILEKVQPVILSQEQLNDVISDLKVQIENIQTIERTTAIKGPRGPRGESVVGPRGSDGLDGNSIIDIKFDQRGHLIIVTTNKTYDLGLLRIKTGSSGSGSSGDSAFTYTNTLPMPTDVGGWPAGSTFNSVPLIQLWTTLLYAYPFPSFTIFTIGNIATLIEVGNNITAGSHNADWSIADPQLLSANSIDINYITGNMQLANDLANVPPQSIILPLISFNVPTPVIFRISAMETTGGSFSRDFIVNFVSKIYVGESILSSLTETDIKALRIRELAETIDGDYELLGGGYKWFCYPVTMGTRDNFIDLDTNYAVAMNTVETVSVTNDFGITEDYYCYRTFNILGGDISIGISS
jgi:hypothetical protein